MSPDTKLYSILGQITYTYSRIDFLLSTIAKDLKIVDDAYDFFSKPTFISKIEELKRNSKIINDPDIESEFITWLDTLNKYREDRNILIHSIILNNAENHEEFLIFNYKQEKKGLTMKIIKNYTIQDLEKLNKSFIDIHNSGYLIWQKLNKPHQSTASQSEYP